MGVASQVPWIVCLESSFVFLPCPLWPHLSKDVAAFTVHYETPKKAIILQKRRQEKPLGTQGLSANHYLRLAQGWQLGSRFMIVSHGVSHSVLHEDFSHASLIPDVHMEISIKLRVEVGHKNKRTTTLLFQPCGPTASVTVYYCCCLLAILVRSLRPSPAGRYHCCLLHSHRHCP